MGLVYSHLDDKREAGDLAGIRDRASEVREMAREGDL
jgi:deoxyribodipyrimidine photolyase-related protein